MPRYPEHLTGEGPANPFPGIKVLERRIGKEIPIGLALTKAWICLTVPYASTLAMPWPNMFTATATPRRWAFVSVLVNSRVSCWKHCWWMPVPIA